MLKLKATRNQLKEGYKNIIKVGYCDLQYLLSYKVPRYYNSNTYGWAYDVYELDFNTIIVTGYAPFGNYTNYDIITKYENLAKSLSYFEKEKYLDELIEKFKNEMLQDCNKI